MSRTKKNEDLRVSDKVAVDVSKIDALIDPVDQFIVDARRLNALIDEYTSLGDAFDRGFDTSVASCNRRIYVLQQIAFEVMAQIKVSRKVVR